MTAIVNTTDFPNQLVAIMYDVISKDLDGVQVSSITLRNKQNGLTRGNWGMYYGRENRITLNVFRDVSYPYTGRTPYLKLERTYHTRAEWLISVLAHEMRHAYQAKLYQGQLTRMHAARLECDAELYERKAIGMWNEFVNQKPSEVK